MAGADVAWFPFAIMYLLYLIPPTLMEVYAYYTRGGLVRYEDVKYDDTFMQAFQWNNDKYIYWKRFVDRPETEAGKAFFSWLDWSGECYDRSIYVWRRNHARENKEISYWWPYIYGPFVFNWTKKTWLRGDDAAGMLMPAWGDGGEARGRAEFAEAKSKMYNKHWHYQAMRRIRRERALRDAEQAKKMEQVAN